MTESLTMEMFIEYAGIISFPLKKELIGQLRGRLEPVSPSPSVLKRSLYVLEELLSNAHEYYKAKTLTAETVSIHVGLQEEKTLSFRVSSVILAADSAELLNRISHVNSQSEGELRMLFQSTLSPAQESEIRSGLGLLTVRLKTGNPFTATLTTKNEDQQLIHITTTLSIL